MLQILRKLKADYLNKEQPQNISHFADSWHFWFSHISPEASPSRNAIISNIQNMNISTDNNLLSWCPTQPYLLLIALAVEHWSQCWNGLSQLQLHPAETATAAVKHNTCLCYRN